MRRDRRRQGAWREKDSTITKLFKKLKVYAGAEHPHEAQNPTPLDVRKSR